MPDAIDMSSMERMPVVTAMGFLRLNRYWKALDHGMWESAVRPFYRHIEGVRLARGIVDRLLGWLLPKESYAHMLLCVAKRTP
jgi:hypothetical protein